MPRRIFVAAAAVLVCVVLAGCGPYLFRQSDRIQLTYPSDHSTVPQPLTVRWTAQEFQAPRDGSFAVFIDRDPMPPGDSMADFPIRSRDGIHLLTTTSLHIDVLNRQVGVDPAEQDHHDVTVVLLDPSGHRIGEYAAHSEFTIDRGGT
jgi:hypothetical protein